MKKLICLTVLSAIAFTLHAKIWRINNKPGVSADFTTAQLAHDNASVLAGDTLHLEPSLNSYGNLSMSKRLVVIGIGYFLAENPGNQAASTPSYIGSLNCYPGSENSVIMIYITTYAAVYTSNITIQRSYITQFIDMDNADNSVIKNCFINQHISLIGGSENVIIANNLVGNHIAVQNTSSASILNNVFNINSSTGSSIYNAVFRNNIIKHASASFSSTASTVENNLAANASALPAGNGNQNSINMATVFVNPSGFVDKDYLLQTGGGNPAIGGGIGGVDCGAFGGTTPFKLAMQPPVPGIYKLQAASTMVGNTLNITISTKSNN